MRLLGSPGSIRPLRFPENMCSQGATQIQALRHQRTVRDSVAPEWVHIKRGHGPTGARRTYSDRSCPPGTARTSATTVRQKLRDGGHCQRYCPASVVHRRSRRPRKGTAVGFRDERLQSEPGPRLLVLFAAVVVLPTASTVSWIMAAPTEAGPARHFPVGASRRYLAMTDHGSSREARSGATGLHAVYRAARLRWPRVALPVDDFSAFLQQRVGDTGSSPPLKHAMDLYLVCACMRGMPAAISALEHEYLDRVLALMSGARERDDLRQAVLERLLLGRAGGPSKLGQYSGRSSLRSWLRVVAVRVLISLHRSEATEPALHDVATLESQWISASSDPEADYVRRRYADHFVRALRSALCGLDERSRQVLRLHAVEHASGQQIASTLGVNRGTVMRWLTNVRQRLAAQARAFLADELGLSHDEVRSVTPLVWNELDAGLSTHLGHGDGSTYSGLRGKGFAQPAAGRAHGTGGPRQPSSPAWQRHANRAE